MLAACNCDVSVIRHVSTNLMSLCYLLFKSESVLCFAARFKSYINVKYLPLFVFYI